MKKILIFLLLISVSWEVSFDTVEEVFKSLETLEYTKEDCEDILNNLAGSFKAFYAYNEIVKNPPQPEFDPNYFKKLDIQQRLKDSIPTENSISRYALYQRIMSVVGDLKDLHISIHFPFSYIEYFFILPIILYIKRVDGQPKMFGKEIKQEYQDQFDSVVIETIKNNTSTAVKSINGKDPFEWVENFCGDYLGVKNIHGTFTYKINILSGGSLGTCPLNKIDFEKFSLVYENNKSFSTPYMFLYGLNKASSFYQNLNKNTNTYKKLKDFIFTPEFDKYLIKFANNPYQRFMNFFEIEESYKKTFLTSHENNLADADDIKWDYSDREDAFQCKIDHENKVNFILIKSYYVNNPQSFVKNVEQCFIEFDKNDYPIIFMNKLNNGGYVDLSHIIEEILSPLFKVNYYSAVTKAIAENANDEFISKFSLGDHDSCKGIDLKDFQGKIESVDYDNGTKVELTDTYLYGYNSRNLYNYFKENKMKKKRKPTEILIYTDGFSYSAASLTIKRLQKVGGAITVGYYGNPLRKNVPFEASHSPTAIGNNLIFGLLDNKNYNALNRFSIHFNSLSLLQQFTNKKIDKWPLEYSVDIVDEYFQLYEHLNKDNYKIFVDEAKKIFEKYKTECNKNNTKLLLITDKCDGKFENEYTHGGFKCGDDGKWSNQCVPSYCDKGYIFDSFEKKCIVDKCEISSFWFSKVAYYISIVLFFLGIIALILFTFYIKHICCFKNISSHSTENLI